MQSLIKYSAASACEAVTVRPGRLRQEEPPSEAWAP